MTPIGILLSLEGDRQVEAGVKRVSGSVDMLGSSVGALRTTLGSVAGAFAGIVSVREFFQAADAVTQLENRLKLVSTSASQATFAYESLYQIANRSRVSFTELGGTYAAIAASAREMGVGQARLLTVTEAIGNAVTISGSSAQAAQAALIQLGQGLASGALRGEELNSVMEQTPRLAQALADGLGVSRGELRKLGEQGAITAERVVQALESQANILKGEVANATLTVGQAMTLLGNNTVHAIGALDKATGASSTAASAIVAIANGINTVGEAAKAHEGAIQTTLGLLAGAATASGALAVARAITGAGGIVAAIGAVRVAVVTLGAVLAANPVGLTLLGLGAVTGAVIANSGAPKSVEGLAREIEFTSQRIEKAERQLASAGGSRGELTRRLEERIAAMRKYRDEMQQSWGAQVGGAVDTTAEDARLASHTAQAKQRAADAAALDKYFSGDVRQTKSQALEEDIKLAISANATLVKGVNERLTGEERIAALVKLRSALEVEVGNINKKHSDKAGAGAASRLLKANTRSDISDLQQAYKTTAEVLANGERILDAQRQAGQISDADYYQAKRAYITSLADAEALALEQQSRILQAQKLPAAERVDADRKIAENAGKVIQLRTKASTDLALSNLQELTTVKALNNAYQDARDSASQQLNASRDRYDRELRGMGMGGEWREANAARNQIDDRYQQERDRLAGDLRRNQITRAQYDEYLSIVNSSNAKALELDRNYWRERAGLQADWTVGASEAYANYLDSARNVASQTESLFSKAFTGAEDALVNFATTGKASFSSLANSIIADLIRIQIRQSMAGSGGGGGGLLGSMFSAGMSLLSGGSTVGSASSAYSLTTASNYTAGGLGLKLDGARANGGGVRAGGLYEVVEEGPELLKVGGRTLLMMGGTAGVVMPATSATGMSSGASSAAAALAGLKVEIVNSGEPAKVEKAEMSTGADGVSVMKVFIAQAVSAAAAEVGAQAAGAYGPVHRGLSQRARMGVS